MCPSRNLIARSFLTFAIAASAQTPQADGGGSDSQTPLQPALFAPGVVSTDQQESYPTFTPDGNILYFKRSRDRSPESQAYILKSELADGVWSAPETASISGKHSDADPFVSPDGRRLFFTSNRPRAGEQRTDQDIWVAEWMGDRWAEPTHLGPTVNSDKNEYSPIVTGDGTLYFSSSREGGLGSGDLYRCTLEGGAYTRPENLGPQVNSSHGEWNVIVSPDETLMIFEASGRAENHSPAGDLYVSRNEAGEWTPAVHLRSLSSEGSDLSPRFSLDGRYLFFASNRPPRPGSLDVYRVELDEVLQALEGRD